MGSRVKVVSQLLRLAQSGNNQVVMGVRRASSSTPGGSPNGVGQWMKGKGSLASGVGSATLHRQFQTGQGRQVESESETVGAPNPQLHQNPSRMEKTVNHVNLMGRVGGDPQKRGSQEHPVVVFSMATHSNYNYQSGGILQKTDWHRICVFKPYLRENVYKYMTKGQRVYVSGRLSYGEVKDENGVAHTATSIIADDVIFLSNSKQESAN